MLNPSGSTPTLVESEEISDTGPQLVPGAEKPFDVRAFEFESAFHSTGRVRDYTHDFYKYPARFDPKFVRYALDAFTEPGDHVLDPFMGGGTTVVEAAAAGRHAIGSDVNELSEFVTRVKTTPLSHQDTAEIAQWVRSVRDAITRDDSSAQPSGTPVKNMPTEVFPFFVTATRLVEHLRFRRRRQFARCALVRVGQWALDARDSIPSTTSMCEELENRVRDMLSGMSAFVAAAQSRGVWKNRITSARRLLVCSADDPRLVRTMREKAIAPKLVLTSPPYPGVHILYHRWQVLGRRETPAPYWIAGIQDGHGPSHYTMGSRSALGLRNYFIGLTAAFSNLRQILAPDARVVQLMSFSDVTVQLPRFLEAMTLAGYEESTEERLESRQVRSVPNRKWYVHRSPSNDASQEMLLIHRPAV